MKLSQAIREGAKLNPKATEAYADLDDKSNCVCTCALGAAWVGAGIGNAVDLYKLLTDPGNDDTGVEADLRDKFPELAAVLFRHPETGQDWSLLGIIPNLNDEYGWTREQIADWIECLGF